MQAGGARDTGCLQARTEVPVTPDRNRFSHGRKGMNSYSAQARDLPDAPSEARTFYTQRHIDPLGGPWSTGLIDMLADPLETDLSPSARRSGLLTPLWAGTAAGALALVLFMGLASACTPAAYIQISPRSGPAGLVTTVSAGSFWPGPVQIRWNGADGPLLGDAQGPNFSVSVTIPAAAPPGVHYVMAVQTASLGTFKASVPFEVSGAEGGTEPGTATQRAAGSGSVSGGHEERATVPAGGSAPGGGSTETGGSGLPSQQGSGSGQTGGASGPGGTASGTAGQASPVAPGSSKDAAAAKGPAATAGPSATLPDARRTPVPADGGPIAPISEPVDNESTGTFLPGDDLPATSGRLQAVAGDLWSGFSSVGPRSSRETSLSGASADARGAGGGVGLGAAFLGAGLAALVIGFGFAEAARARGRDARTHPRR